MALSKSSRILKHVLTGNVLLGLLVFAGAVYLMITGQYPDLAARQQTEFMLNLVALGGLAYSVISLVGSMYLEGRSHAGDMHHA